MIRKVLLALGLVKGRKKSCSMQVKFHNGESLLIDGNLTTTYLDAVGNRCELLRVIDTVEDKDGNKVEVAKIETPLANVKYVSGPITIFEKTWWK